MAAKSGCTLFGEEETMGKIMSAALLKFLSSGVSQTEHNFVMYFGLKSFF